MGLEKYRRPGDEHAPNPGMLLNRFNPGFLNDEPGAEAGASINQEDVFSKRKVRRENFVAALRLAKNRPNRFKIGFEVNSKHQVETTLYEMRRKHGQKWPEIDSGETLNRSGLDSSTATTAELAQTVNGLLTDLRNADLI